MRWIDATQLTDWARRIDARASLINMIADLIRASACDPRYFRFPGGDKAQVRGFDGDLEASIESAFVPQGKSKWEFGISAGVKKANEDYAKRTAEVSDAEKVENTLVLVSLHTWDTPTIKLPDWVQDKRDTGAWLDVQLIDGAQLEHWLDSHPAVAARYAREILGTAPRNGAVCFDEFWETYSNRFTPRLDENVLLCDREAQAAALLQKLSGTSQTFMFGAESSEDVVAFAVAAVRLAAPETRSLLEARSLIVESSEAARFLSSKRGMTYITMGAADQLAGTLGIYGPTLSAAVGVQARRHEKLVRPSASALGRALATMVPDDGAAYELARKCGRSITILQRLIPNGPIKDPEWLNHSDALLPAILAGGWSTNSELDKALLAQLSGKTTYGEFEAGVRKTLPMSDPPMDCVDDVWQVRSPVDAFPYFGHLVGEVELERLRAAALAVFGHMIEAEEPRAKFTPGYKPQASYSTWLRDGLAFTLLQFATVTEVSGLVLPGQTPQHFVDEILRSLPGLGVTHKILASLSDQLASLAEAAPIPFLSALESMLEGDLAEIKAIFSESDDFFAPTSTHVYVLWALEVLAWDPKWLPRSSMILAQLAAIDVGTKSGNRPINSLQSIFLSWSPNTYAHLQLRVACIDGIVAFSREIGWNLVTRLLPERSSWTSPSQKPRLRDVVPKKVELITDGIVAETDAMMVTRALAIAADDELRACDLVGFLGHFHASDRKQVLSFIEGFLGRHDEPPKGEALWLKLHDEVKRHQSYADADWAMQHSELSAFVALVEKHRPTDTVTNVAWLFDDWMPNVGRIADDPMAEAENERAAALSQVLRQDGVPGILRLVKRAKLPHLVASSLQQCDLSIAQVEQLVSLALECQPPLLQFACPLSGIAQRKFGDDWIARFDIFRRNPSYSPEMIAHLILQWTDTRATWDVVATLGSAVETAYWKATQSLPRESSIEDLLFAVNKYRAVGRPLAVLNMIFKRLAELPGSVILIILDEGVVELNRNERAYGTMLSHSLGLTFECLEQKTDVSLEDIARREYAYLPLLDRRSKSLILHRFMASDPPFYFEAIAHAFRAEGEEPGDLSDFELARARTSYDLLTSFHVIPGTDADGINLDALIAWVDEVRRLAAGSGRVDIADQFIGRLLAHAPIDERDNAWPVHAVRLTIEHAQSDRVERGIAIERFNMRGVHSRAIGAGGAQERELASMYRAWAAATEGFPRTSTLNIVIAEQWERDASREDIGAEQEKLRR